MFRALGLGFKVQKFRVQPYIYPIETSGKGIPKFEKPLM